jgi:N-methylhydantoinase B
MYRVVSGIMKALHPVLPDRLPAAGKSLVVNLGFAGWTPRMKEYYCYMETVGGGDGARPMKDGYDAVQSEMQNTENAPIEEVELNYPIMIKRYELIEDSGGPGRFRGGLGVRRDFWFPDQECSFSILSDGRKFPPWGLAGGGDGACARYVLDPDGEARELPSKVTLRIPPGGVVSVETPGGGGFGPVVARDPQAVRQDVANRKVSGAAAQAVYGLSDGRQAAD